MRARQSNNAEPNCYQVLQVHPAAPLDLITAAYWRLALDAHAKGAMDISASAAELLGLARAYATLADADARSAHDSAHGLAPQNLVPALAYRKRISFLRRLIGRRSPPPHGGNPSVDYYEILRVDPAAHPAILAEAHASLRNYYMSAVRMGTVPGQLIDLLEEAYAVVSDPDRRSKYDAARTRSSSAEMASAPSPAQLKGSESGRIADQSVGQPRAASPPTLATKGSGTAASRRTPSGRSKATAVKAAARDRPSDRASAPIASDQKQTLGGRQTAGRPWRQDLATALAASGRLTASIVLILWKGVSQALGSLRKQAGPITREEWTQTEQDILRRLSTMAKSTEGASVVPERQGHSAAARLVLLEGPGAGATFELDHFPLTLGSAKNCDIRLPGLPAQRVRLYCREGQFSIHDLAAVKPTAGEVVPWHLLENGDDLNLGPYKFRFTIPRQHL